MLATSVCDGQLVGGIKCVLLDTEQEHCVRPTCQMRAACLQCLHVAQNWCAKALEGDIPQPHDRG